MVIAQNVTFIPAKRKIGTQSDNLKKPKIRVAAYCRVSTESEEQESSFDVQVSHYTSYIKSNPEWELVDIYADDGISGTNTMKREAFNRMIADCRAKKIDLILVKSISRFSRNTVDCLKYTRELKDLNIGVFFEKENINTLDSKGEVLMTIMAALAQQESESLSANVRLGLQFRNQQGKIQVNHTRFLGYTKDSDGNLIIDPEEAKVVRRIFAEYLEGASFSRIKAGLEKDGILNGAHNAKWHESNIKQILTNEKYIGDAMLQKTCTISILDKKRVANDGIAPKYYVEGSHEPIIDREVFHRVQSEIMRRAILRTQGSKRIYSSKYALSGRVYCGCCGTIYRRIKWNNRGCKSTVWRCLRRVEKGDSEIKCSARTIRESDLHEAVITAVNDAYASRGVVIPELQKNIRAVLEEEYTEKLERLEESLLEKQMELLKAENDQAAAEKIGDEILSLREEKREEMTDIGKLEERLGNLQKLNDYLDQQVDAITGYSEELVRRLIEKVAVYDEKVTVEFKSGLVFDVDL